MAVSPQLSTTAFILKPKNLRALIWAPFQECLGTYNKIIFDGHLLYSHCHNPILCPCSTNTRRIHRKTTGRFLQIPFRLDPNRYQNDEKWNLKEFEVLKYTIKGTSSSKNVQTIPFEGIRLKEFKGFFFPLYARGVRPDIGDETDFRKTPLSRFIC